MLNMLNFMKGDVDSTYADISLANADLGYRPQRSFKGCSC